MTLDISTVVFVASIIFTTQTVAVFLQYIVNKTYNGLGWWLWGAILQALGFLLMLALNSLSIQILAVFANPLIFLGQIFLNVGIKKFLDRKVNRWAYIALFGAYSILYFSFVALRQSIFARSLVVSASAAIIAMATALTIQRGKERLFSRSANFTAGVFFVYGCLQVAISAATLALPPLASYDDFFRIPLRSFAFIIPISGSMLWTFGFIIMVNQRLNAENLEEKEKLRMVFNISPDAKLITRMSDGLLIDFNSGFLSMTGFTPEEIAGKSIVDIDTWHELGDMRGFMEELRAKGAVDGKEVYFKRKDGSKFVGLISSRRIAIKGQAHLVSVINDITERKESEREIRDLLAEKELILKEVHHRIKNNMNTIYSLLSLQAASLKEASAITALEDAGNRVQSMMMLYDLLFKSASFTDLSLNEYLPPLVDEIVSNFPNADSIRVEKRVDDFVLEMRVLQPLGIIINELITNIMKYAFVGLDEGMITVSAALAEGRVTVVVQDNGRGMPESVDFENSTGFGLMVVGALAAQLKGTIKIERGGGTRIILEFDR